MWPYGCPGAVRGPKTLIRTLQTAVECSLLPRPAGLYLSVWQHTGGSRNCCGRGHTLRCDQGPGGPIFSYFLFLAPKIRDGIGVHPRPLRRLVLGGHTGHTSIFAHEALCSVPAPQLRKLLRTLQSVPKLSEHRLPPMFRLTRCKSP